MGSKAKTLGALLLVGAVQTLLTMHVVSRTPTAAEPQASSLPPTGLSAAVTGPGPHPARTLPDLDYSAVDGGVMAMRAVPRGSVGVVLMVYKRRTLERQLRAIYGQTHAPAEVIVWQDERHVDVADVVERYRPRGLSFVQSTRNFKFHGRFAVALMFDTEFVFIVDDDQIPGSKYLETCIRASREHNAIISGTGRVITTTGLWSCAGCGDGGWAPEDREVDVGCQSWFVRTEWLRRFWSVRMPSWANGEDIDLSASLKLLGGVRTFVPRMPAGDRETWKDRSGGLIGNDNVATHKRPDHAALRHNITNYWLQLGWTTLNRIHSLPIRSVGK
eukprot:m51a1_g4895 hypothetical protein (331) ;mRNA; r:126300-127483